MTAIMLLLAGVQAPQPATVELACHLTTPASDVVAFRASLGAPTGTLEPVGGTAWPQAKVIGPGAWRQKKQLEARYHFAGKPTGVDLQIRGERATLFVGKRLGSGAPRAHGFCLPSSEPHAAGERAVSPSAGAAVPAFDSARWPLYHCGLVTRSGRRSRIDYSILGGGTASEIKTSDAKLVPSGRVVVPRVFVIGGRTTRFGARNGPSGTERLELDAKAGEAVQLIDFDRIGADAASETPAAAICGHAGIVRRPVAR